MPDFNKRESTYNIGWMPKTRLGQLVYQGKITTMSEALNSRHPLKEPEIVDILLPEMEDEVLDVNMVQRMTDSGRRVRFAITVVVGNGDGFVGMGRAKGKEVGPTIRNAIDRAKLNIIEVKRGCGSWECGCGNPHTLPFEVEGKCGSVRVMFKPAPQGVGLALGNVAKKVASMAGIKDAWGFAKGHTKTTVNYSFAAFEALRETSRIKVTETQTKNLHIMSGPSQVVYLETSPEELKQLLEDKKRKESEKISEKEKEIVKDTKKEKVAEPDQEPDEEDKPPAPEKAPEGKPEDKKKASEDEKDSEKANDARPPKEPESKPAEPPKDKGRLPTGKKNDKPEKDDGKGPSEGKEAGNGLPKAKEDGKGPSKDKDVKEPIKTEAAVDEKTKDAKTPIKEEKASADEKEGESE